MTFGVFMMAVWGIAVTIFWMVVGFRAMRAHERLADEVRSFRLNRKNVPEADNQTGPR